MGLASPMKILEFLIGNTPNLYITLGEMASPQFWLDPFKNVVCLSIIQMFMSYSKTS